MEQEKGYRRYLCISNSTFTYETNPCLFKIKKQGQAMKINDSNKVKRKMPKIMIEVKKEIGKHENGICVFDLPTQYDKNNLYTSQK